MARENPQVRIFILGMCAVIFFLIIAYNFPLILAGFFQSTNFLVGNLIVQAGVFLQYGGNNVAWPPGTYSSCTISLNSTDCLQSQVTSQPVVSPLLILFAVISIFALILLMLAFAIKALEER